MFSEALIGAFTGALALALALYALLRPRAPRALQRVPDDWRARLRSIPQAHLVPPGLQARYEARVEAFLREKKFIGCNGLVVTDEMRVAIAALAVLLILRPQAQVYPHVHTVLLYPEAFLVPQTEPDEDGLVSDAPVEQVGESWQGDRVVLSWADVQAALEGDEVNVVAHEFAHQLDDETPEAEGAPPLADYARWSAIMQREYQRLQRHRRPPVLDPYGAESPAEFFAVVTESYFQRGAELAQHHGELYALLRDYYLLDTARA